MSLIHPHRDGFNTGVNAYGETLEKTGMDLDIVIVNKNDTWSLKEKGKEAAVIIVAGSGTIEFQGSEFSFDRPNWIDCDPTVIHMSPGENVKISTLSQSRIAVVQTINENKFQGNIYLPEDIDTEHRGKN